MRLADLKASFQGTDQLEVSHLSIGSYRRRVRQYSHLTPLLRYANRHEPWLHPSRYTCPKFHTLVYYPRSRHLSSPGRTSGW